MKIKEKKARNVNLKKAQQVMPNIYEKLRLVNGADEELGFIVTNWETHRNFLHSERGDLFPYETQVTINGYIPHED